MMTLLRFHFLMMGSLVILLAAWGNTSLEQMALSSDRDNATEALHPEKADSRTPDDEAKPTVTISLHSGLEGTLESVKVNNQEVGTTLEDLKQALPAEAASVSIDNDPGLRYGILAQVMDLCFIQFKVNQVQLVHQEQVMRKVLGPAEGDDQKAKDFFRFVEPPADLEAGPSVQPSEILPIPIQVQLRRNLAKTTIHLGQRELGSGVTAIRGLQVELQKLISLSDLAPDEHLDLELDIDTKVPAEDVAKVLTACLGPYDPETGKFIRFPVQIKLLADLDDDLRLSIFTELIGPGVHQIALADFVEEEFQELAPLDLEMIEPIRPIEIEPVRPVEIAPEALLPPEIEIPNTLDPLYEAPGLMSRDFSPPTPLNVTSQESVERGLKWLAQMQQPDGSWNFSKLARNSQEGSADKLPNAATSFALLCFLGNGQTMDQGKYQKNVKHGLEFLLKKAKLTPDGLDLRSGGAPLSGGIYEQALCTLVLCEAFAVSEKGTSISNILKLSAQRAVDFLVRWQDPQSGGWRYQPRQAGDLSCTSITLLALFSARQAKLLIPQNTWKGANDFLDSVTENQIHYSYIPSSSPGVTTTVMGLLCREIMGREPENENLQAGVSDILKRGPHRAGTYSNLFATLLLHRVLKEENDRWQTPLRKQILSTQITDGPEAGSWNVTDPYAQAGGRLYETCLRILILEIPGQHLLITKTPAPPEELEP